MLTNALLLHCLLLEFFIACCFCVSMLVHCQGKWYVVFEGRIPGVYSSWEACNKQVSGYNDNNHKGGFKTRQAAEDAYSKYVHKHASNVEVGKAPHHYGLCGMKNIISSSSSS